MHTVLTISLKSGRIKQSFRFDRLVGSSANTMICCGFWNADFLGTGVELSTLSLFHDFCFRQQGLNLDPLGLWLLSTHKSRVEAIATVKQQNFANSLVPSKSKIVGAKINRNLNFLDHSYLELIIDLTNESFDLVFVK